MSEHRIIVVGASAGGVEALKQLVSGLPANFPATLLIVLHVSPFGTSVLPQILNRVGALSAMHPKDGQVLEKGHIYVAPPDHHMLLKRGYISLNRGPRENGTRPAVDPTFRSAARYYDGRVIGVVLSGVLDDGTSGLLTVKAHGGISVVQDPEDALYSGMPLSAIEHSPVDYIVPIAEMAALFVRLVHEPLPPTVNLSDIPDLEFELDIVELDMDAVEGDHRPGVPSVYACPECGGTLWEIQDGDLIRFRCRVGHAFSAQTLLAEQSEALEEAFWAALRALEESAALARRMAERSQERGQHYTAARYKEQAEDTERRAKLVREALLSEMSHAHHHPALDQEATDEKTPNEAQGDDT